MRMRGFMFIDFIVVIQYILLFTICTLNAFLIFINILTICVIVFTVLMRTFILKLNFLAPSICLVLTGPLMKSQVFCGVCSV